jgi:two-component system phosphate regulon sensor histidine kinase PhoR
MLAGLVLRFWGLGDKAFHHDESLHAFYSWRLYDGQGYVHDPMMHGPLLFELNALTGNEKIVREIYQNQLDAILYSINQYSDDVIGSWANRFNIALMEEKNVGDSLRGIPAVLNQFGAVRYLYCSDSKNRSNVFGTEANDTEGKSVQKRLDSLVRSNQARIEQLLAYEKAGFRKMELMDTLNMNRPIPVFFVLSEGTPTYRLGAMVITSQNL